MRSMRSSTHPEDLPELGTRQAAVESCVSLISRVCGQPEAIMAYWLDLYYQVRLAYEIEEDQRRRSERFKLDTERIKNGLEALGLVRDRRTPTTEGEPEHGEAEAQAEVLAQGEMSEMAAVKEEQGAEESAPPQEGNGLPPGFKPVTFKNRGAQPGNSFASTAAHFKREIAERLHRMRREGLRTPAILQMSNGQLEDDDIRKIMEFKRVPIEKYRVLAGVLDRLEQ